MDLETLESKRSAAETRFNEIANQIKELQTEQSRLQGAHRTLTALIDELKVEPKVVKEPKKK